MEDVGKYIEGHHAEEEGCAAQAEDDAESLVDGAPEDEFVGGEECLCAVERRDGEEIEEEQYEVDACKAPEEMLGADACLTHCCCRGKEAIVVVVFCICLVASTRRGVVWLLLYEVGSVSVCNIVAHIVETFHGYGYRPLCNEGRRHILGTHVEAGPGEKATVGYDEVDRHTRQRDDDAPQRVLRHEAPLGLRFAVGNVVLDVAAQGQPADAELRLEAVARAEEAEAGIEEQTKTAHTNTEAACDDEVAEFV